MINDWGQFCSLINKLKLSRGDVKKTNFETTSNRLNSVHAVLHLVVTFHQRLNLRKNVLSQQKRTLPKLGFKMEKKGEKKN